MVTNNYNDELDPISFWILLLLSGGQQFTFHDIVKSMNRSYESVWDALQTLQSKKFAKNQNSKFMIAFAGVEYLTKRGILATEAEEEPKPKDFKKKVKPPFFSTWTELLIWLALPSMLFLVAAAISIFLTLGYNFVSLEKRIYQYSVWIIYLIFLGVYVKLSYHHVIENEKIVVFQSGEAITKKGPGHILLLPLVQNPKKVDLRERPLEIKKEPCITRDKMLITAGFYLTWQIEDPIPSLTKVSKVEDSILLLSTAILRSTIAEYTLDEALERQRALNTLIRTRIEHKAGDWGVQVNTTELRELQPSINVMKQIENRFNAALESEAALTKSDAHVESLRRLFQIGSRIDDRTFNLKYLDTLEKIGEGPSTKYVIPMEFFNLLRDWMHTQGNGNSPGNGNPPRNENNPPEQLPPGGTVQ